MVIRRIKEEIECEVCEISKPISVMETKKKRIYLCEGALKKIKEDIDEILREDEE